MRHVDDRRLHALVQALDLGAHIDAQFRIEIGQRLVEQEDLGLRTSARPMATRWRWPPDSCGRAAGKVRCERSSMPAMPSRPWHRRHRLLARQSA
jgi:hypothetical protein